jgi:hypothetical protein
LVSYGGGKRISGRDHAGLFLLMDVPLCAFTQALETFCKVRARIERA